MRGHPVLGAFSGLVFGIGLDLVLLVQGSLTTNSVLVVVILAAGLVVGIAWGAAGPLGRREAAPAAALAPAGDPGGAGDGPDAAATGPDGDASA